MSTKLIVMPSLGYRPWVSFAAETFQYYANFCDADFVLETNGRDLLNDLSVSCQLSDTPGRPNKEAYAFKSIVAHKWLQQYDRVLVVDDTCVAMPTAPNIFVNTPFGGVAGKTTGVGHAVLSFAAICGWALAWKGEPCSTIRVRSLRMAENSVRIIQKITRDGRRVNHSLIPALNAGGYSGIRFELKWYFNTGVMLYDCPALNAISPENIQTACTLLYSNHPHQTLSYYLLSKSNLPLYQLDRRYNTKPGESRGTHDRLTMRRTPGELAYSIDPPFIYHVTGAYKYRSELIENLSTLSLSGWRQKDA